LVEAALDRRLLDRELGVGLGDLGLAARVVVVALVELVLREVVVRFGHRELDRRAVLCALVARGGDQGRGRGGLRADLAGAARGEGAGRTEGDHGGDRAPREPRHGVPFAGAGCGGWSLAGAPSLAGPALSLAGATSRLGSEARFDGSRAAIAACSVRPFAASVARRP